jgi:hypothetical protein
MKNLLKVILFCFVCATNLAFSASNISGDSVVIYSDITATNPGPSVAQTTTQQSQTVNFATNGVSNGPGSGGSSGSSCSSNPSTAYCSQVAGSYGIPASYTSGIASFFTNSCTGVMTYNGGCY